MLANTALSLGVVTDVFTAASLSFFLHRMRTGYKRYAFRPLLMSSRSSNSDRSDTLINRLIMYSVNTGALTR
jgi:hypothetical protein